MMPNTPQEGQFQGQYQAPTPYVMPTKPSLPFKTYDRVLAIATLALGFIFWKWEILFVPSLGLGIFLFFILTIAVGLIYMEYHGIKQNTKSLICLAIIVGSLLPFILFDRIDIEFFLNLFIITLYVVWVSYSCNTNIAEKLSGFVASDLINQWIIVPFSNFGNIFICIFKRNGENKKEKRVFAAIIGIIVSIPIIVLIISLLIAADDGFANLAKNLPNLLNAVTFDNMIYFIFGIPVACYIFGSVSGNSNKRSTGKITKEGTATTLANAHKIPTASIYAPLIILNILYVVFFIAMGSYLFSAFAGDLPNAYTYAEYARKGFFELCGVSAINLIIIIFVYCFTKRNPGCYPKNLRGLTGILSGLTILLIATAMSKMLLYIGAYGLTRLRVYTLWFMILLLITFIVILIWHIRPFNAGKPIAIAFVAMVMILFLSNTDGLIAKYNFDQYKNGALPEIDVWNMTYMSDAVVPYLNELKNNASDKSVRDQATQAIYTRKEHSSYEYNPAAPDFLRWNLQSHRVSNIE